MHSPTTAILSNHDMRKTSLSSSSSSNKESRNPALTSQDANSPMMIMTTEQQEESLHDVVSKVVSEVCIITLLKVLDNIIEEKTYNAKTRRFKLTNPTFQKRIICHAGGLEVLYLSGFDDKRPSGSATAVTVAAGGGVPSSSNHSVTSATAATTTTTVLELLPDQEDKEWLWQVRQALYQHGKHTLGLTKLPLMPPAPPKSKAKRKTSLSSTISHCSNTSSKKSSSQRASADKTIRKEEGSNSDEEPNSDDNEDEKKQDGWDLPWEATNHSSNESRQHISIKTTKSDDVVISESQNVNLIITPTEEPPTTGANQGVALDDTELESQVVDDMPTTETDDVIDFPISMTTAPLKDGDNDNDSKEPTMQRAASWKSKLDEFLATLDTEKQVSNEDEAFTLKDNEPPTPSEESTKSHLTSTSNDNDFLNDDDEDDNNATEPSGIHQPFAPTEPVPSITSTAKSTLDLILGDVDDASPLKFDSDTRKQMGEFLMDAQNQKHTKSTPTTKSQNGGTNNKWTRATPLPPNRKVPTLQEIVDGTDGDSADKNLKAIFADIKTASNTQSAVNNNRDLSLPTESHGLDSILAEIDVVLRTDSMLPSGSDASAILTSPCNIGKPTESSDVVQPSSPEYTEAIDDNLTPPSPPSSSESANAGSWSPKIDSDKQAEYMNMLQESISSFDPEKVTEAENIDALHECQREVVITETSTMTTSPQKQDDVDEWFTLCTLMRDCSLSDEFEPCWGALCKLSEICSNLMPPFDKLRTQPADKTDSDKLSTANSALLQSWIPTDVIIALWEIVMKDEGANPARTGYVKGQLRQVLISGEHIFLEKRTGEDLPHASWVRVANEKLIRVGVSLPVVEAKAEVWLLQLCDYLLIDASSWYGRYAILEIFGRARDTAQSDQVESLLNSTDFIQSRLDVLGLDHGTIRHIQDCKNYIDNLLRHEFLKQDEAETVPTEEIGLAVCQHLATCLYRTGQLLDKDEAHTAKAEKVLLAKALHQLGLAAGEWRDYDFEMQLYGRVLVIRREVCEPGSEEIGDTLLVIGACHQSQANLGAAMSCYEEALDMFKAHLGEHHDKVAEALHNIGVVHCERSELDAAMGNLKSSFKIRQDNRDTKSFDADMSDTLCWIGKVYREQGHLQKAYKYFATACASKEEITGKDSLDVAEILHNIAVIHDDQGEFDVSLEFYTKSLEIKRRRLGEDHEDVCELLTCIGHVYLLMGEDSKALKVFRRVLEKRTNMKSSTSKKAQTKMLLQTYADVIDILRDQSMRAVESKSVRDYLAATLLEMGQLYESVGEYDKGLACLDECLTIASELNDHVRVGQALNTAGIAHAKRRHYDVAMDAFEQALAIRKGFLDEHNVDVAETLHNMGNCAAKQKDFNQARSHYDESLRIKRRLMGSTHPSVAQTLHNIGCIMSEQGFDDAAMNYLREALSVRRVALGDDHLEVAYSLHSIGKVQRRRNEINDSIENFKASLRIKSRRLYKKQSSLAETLEQLGELHAIKGDIEQTLFYFEEALVALKGSSQRCETAKIHEALGKAYEESKDYAKAKSNFTKALKIAEKLYGSRDSRVAQLVHKLGNVQRKLGDNQEALSLYQRATKICKDNLGRNDSTIADVLSDAGDLQMELGQFEVAHKCFSEALRIRRAVFGGGDVAIAESLLQLGDVEHFTGRFAHAIEYYNESAAIFRASEGDKSAKVADCLERLGCCHRALREFEKAIQFFDVCIRIRKDSSVSQSLSLAEAYHQLGCVYFETEEYSKAEQLFRDCVEIRVKLLGEDHLDIADSVLMLGRVCVKINSPHEAMMYFEQAQLIRKNQLGEKHLDYAELMREIGTVHEMNGDYKESLKNFNLYLQIRREVMGDDVIVGDTLHSIGKIEFTMQRYNGALKSLATALALFKVLLGDDNLSVAKTLYSLGLVYDTKGDDKEALKYHKEAFRLRRTLLGADHLHVAQSLDSICALYVRQQNHEKALQGLKEALRIRTLRLGNDNLEVASTLFAMGVVFCGLGDKDRSKECYLASLKIRREHLGVKSVEVGQTLHNLGSVYGQEQDYDQALKYWKEAMVSYKDAGLGDEDHLSAITIGNIHMAESLLSDQPRPVTPEPSVDNNIVDEEESDSWFQDD